jgi:cytochrome c oxidase subunit 2
MPFHSRPRRLAYAALTVALVALVAACGKNYPDSIFHNRTDFNREVDFLFRILIWLGVAVFIFVEAVLVWALVKYRARPGQAEPEHVHGNTTLEIAWTVIPAVILVVIAIPTVRTIFKTQSAAVADALQVEVIGHQWWWEFRYPQYKVVTANELYLPVGRTVNFKLNSVDVIHSFWIPALAGKRDVMPGKHTNYLWFTPDSSGEGIWNGVCVEYCGTSHANMRFKTFTVSQTDFEGWAAHQAEPAIGTTPVVPAAAPPAAQTPNRPVAQVPATPPPAAPQAPGFIAIPADKMPAYAMPTTPLPNIPFDDNLKGDPANGVKLLTGAGTCFACHQIAGVPNMNMGLVGPNLTHLATRTTIASGLYPNDTRHLARWIKNARAMKPGVLMTTLGAGQFDPMLKRTLTSGLSDQQIADIVAYLQTLK